MALKDIQIPSEEIEVGGTKIVLRPLSLKESSTLLRKHISTLTQAWAKFGQLIQNDDPIQAQTALLAAIGECSDLIADLVATSAGEPESAELVCRLPIDVQFRAAITVFRLTGGSTDQQTILRDFHEAMAAAGAGLSVTLN